MKKLTIKTGLRGMDALVVQVARDILVKYAGKLPNKFCVYKDGRLRIRK